MRTLTSGLLLLALAAPALAQAPYLVKDVNPIGAGSDPMYFFDVGGAVYFQAHEPATGLELWVSDGTADGTRLAADVRPGPDSSRPGPFAALGGVLYFGAFDGSTGRELWASDGTPEGTRLVKDIAPGLSSSLAESVFVGAPVVLGDEIFFAATREGEGEELWASDGTTAGTRLVADLQPGSLGSSPALLTVSGDTLFFTARTDETGRALWASDGTEEGTRLVRIFLSGPFGFPWPTDLVDFAGEPGRPRLAFVAADPDGGRVVWTSDGTAEGTLRLLPGFSPTAGSRASQLIVAEDTLFYYAADPLHGDELWASDGTADGTRLVRDVYPGERSSLAFESAPAAVGGRIFFSADDGEHGYELWVSDGTAEGTRLVRDIYPGSLAGSPRGSLPAGLTALGDRVVFVADDGESGREPWVSDGSEAGTRLLADVVPGAADPGIAGLAAAGDFVVFVANDGATGPEPWVSDGTEAGTRLIRDVNQAGTMSSGPKDFRAAGDTLFFSADDPTGEDRLWASDGTEAGTRRLSETVSVAQSVLVFPVDERRLAVLGGRLFFAGRSDADGDVELWASDGTPAGTLLVADVEPGVDPSSPQFLTPAGDTLYFMAVVEGHEELWASDGTAAGTRRVKDVLGGAYAHFTALTAAEDLVFFGVDRGPPQGLWVSDGTEAGTVQLVADRPLQTAPTAVGRRVYFPGFDEASGAELWTSDGTVSGTISLDLVPGAGSSSPAELTAVGEALYFNTFEVPGASGLWRLDDPAARPVRLFPGFGHIVGHEAGIVYFSVEGGPDRTQLWRTDGTPEGTVRIRDFRFDPYSGVGLTGALYFFAWEPETGSEPWRTDGTRAGTVRLGDIRPGSGSSGSSEMLAAGRRMYFSASDGTLGQELWAIEPGCLGAPSALCLQQGRFQAQVRWRDPKGVLGSHPGRAVGATDDTGSFWFFDPANVELAVKVLDGRAINGHWWVFYGSLSDVGFELTITDLEAGGTRLYTNPQGRFASAGDVRAFPAD